MRDFKIAEYQSLQAEITERAKILHGTLNIGTILLFISILVLLTLKILEVDKQIIYLYLLSLPLVFASLIFNYQANGFTLEMALRYTQELFKNSWRPFYVKKRQQFKLIGFTKIFSVLVPLSMPLFLINRIVLSNDFSLLLFVVDIILIFVVILNFAYKLIYSK